MAELILTEEEKALPYWNDLDDASLGRAVKKFGMGLLKSDIDNDSNKQGFENLMLKAAVIGMCNFIQANGADEYTGTITGLTDESGNPAGDWEVTYRRIG